MPAVEFRVAHESVCLRNSFSSGGGFKQYTLEIENLEPNCYVDDRFIKTSRTTKKNVYDLNNITPTVMNLPFYEMCEDCNFYSFYNHIIPI